jgi:flagella basal body P-ring formation protein FlgA
MVYSRPKIGFNVILWGIVFVWMIFSVQAAEIRLKNAPVQMTETWVTLADIADVLPMGSENIESLRQTVLFPTPANGETRTLDQWGLRSMLSQLGINSLHHSICGAENIAIIGIAARNVAMVNPNEQFVIQANHLTPTGTNPVTPIAVRSEVSPQVSGLTDDIVRLLEEQIAQALRVYLNFTNRIERTWDISLKLTPEQIQLFASNGQIAEITGGQIPFTGVQQFHVRMQNSVTITVDAVVVLPLEVVVARRTLPKGHIINESDVMLRRADSINGDDFFVDTKSVVGREVVRQVRDLTALTQSSIRSPLWVRKGEIVTVRAAKNGILVRTEATALQDGIEGDTISVEKIDLNSTRRGGKREEPVTYLVRVCAPKTVEVFVK